jgi:methylthioribose-1-phosphate isomerase
MSRPNYNSVLPTILYNRGAVEIIDQTLLPAEYKILRITSVEILCESIRSLRVRGAPALGVAGAFGLLLALEEKWPAQGEWYFDNAEAWPERLPSGVTAEAIQRHLLGTAETIRATRPTAVNLGWAIERMMAVVRKAWKASPDLLRALHAEAQAIREEDLAMCASLGRHGASLLSDGDRVLTHCNTGGLATSGLGTALGVVFAAVDSGKKIHVYADETRPLLQGARLTAWECDRRGVEVSVLCDGAAASLLSRGLVSCVMVGADRIARNGDTANKIGTLGLAIAARHYRVPFYVAAPSTTIDRSLVDGSTIARIIEERPEAEVKQWSGVATTPPSVRAVNPAFDVTPGALVTGFVTEAGVIHPPF